jgi:hypothetical protein
MNKPTISRVPVSKIQKGQRIVYHIGFLPIDRRKNKELDTYAQRLQERSEGGFIVELRINSGKMLMPGTGELELTQKKIKDFEYIYYARRKLKDV